MPFKVLPFAYSEMTEFKLLKDNLLGRTSKTFMLGLVILREGFLPPSPLHHQTTVIPLEQTVHLLVATGCLMSRFQVGFLLILTL